MGVLFDRKYRLKVQTLPLIFLEISSVATVPQLDFNFRVTRTLSSEPNTCEVNIRNMNPIHRNELEIMEASEVEIEAGYVSQSGVIFQGDIRNIENNKESTDWITTLASGDGEKTIQEARVNKSFPAGTTVITVLTEIAKTMRVANDGKGASLGNTLAIAPLGSLLGSGKQFLNGCVVSGPSAKEFDRICKSAGLEWSIQNNAIQLLVTGQPLPVSAVVLSPQTGLIGSPRVGNDGVIFIRSLLMPNIEPGKIIQVVSTGLNATTIAQRCDYRGDTAGQDWYIDTEAVRL